MHEVDFHLVHFPPKVLHNSRDAFMTLLGATVRNYIFETISFSTSIPQALTVIARWMRCEQTPERANFTFG